MSEESKCVIGGFEVSLTIFSFWVHLHQQATANALIVKLCIYSSLGQNLKT